MKRAKKEYHTIRDSVYEGENAQGRVCDLNR